MDISKNTQNLSNNDYNLQIDRQNQRTIMIGNLTWSKEDML